MEYSLSKKMMAEVVGTFLLVFFGTGAAVGAAWLVSQIMPQESVGAYGIHVLGIGTLAGLSEWLAVSFAFGISAIAIIYAFAKVSGA
ncbi:MAG: aquaporin, partial [Methanobrevibacter sp.]|nr:aquaporin [Methanobrevibacter sp.]